MFLSIPIAVFRIVILKSQSGSGSRSRDFKNHYPGTDPKVARKSQSTIRIRDTEDTMYKILYMGGVAYIFDMTDIWLDILSN